MAQKAPKVSIIIVNWNSGEHLKRCLGAVNRQTLKPYRIIIIDNSSDYTPDEKHSGQNTIEIIRPGKNIGFAAASNLGAEKSTDCDWIALLNPDAFPESNWLENLIASAEKYPEFSFFGSRLIRSDEPSILDGVADHYHTSGLAWRYKHGCRQSSNENTHREIFSPCAAAALYRKDAFFDAGGFDQQYFCYLEDVDLGFRLRLLGYRCLYVPDAVVRHVGSSSTGKHSDFTIYHGHRNIVWTFFKNMPLVLLIYYLPQHLLLNIVTLAWFSLQGRWAVIFRAKYDAIADIPQILVKRREIQKQRRVKSYEIIRHMAVGPLAVFKRS